jgi:hypothetical protein
MTAILDGGCGIWQKQSDDKSTRLTSDKVYQLLVLRHPYTAWITFFIIWMNTLPIHVLVQLHPSMFRCLKNVKSLPMCYEANIQAWKGPGGSMSWVAGLPNNSYKPITNTTWSTSKIVFSDPNLGSKWPPSADIVLI